MKKIAIVTLSDFNNYGNRLQNYALERIITSQGYDVVSLVDFRPNLLKTSVKTIIKKDGIKFTDRMKKIRRLKNFLDFDKKYVNTFPVNAGEFSSVSDDEYHCFIVGSDQVWNPDWAKYTYDSSTAYGSYIDTEYSTTLQELQNAVDSAASALEQAQTSLEDYQAQLEEVTTAYEDAAQVLSNCQYSLNNTDPADDTYGYVYFAQLTTQAQSTADSLEQQKEELEQKVEQAEENVTTAETAYNKAKRELEQGKLTAAETKKLRTLAYNTAQETYDIALGYLEQDLSDQQETYDETLEKWNEFSTYIDGNAVCARYNGVITSVELEAGDKISTGTSLVTLYDMDEVTMTVTVDEDDMTDISLGSAANIALTAYPEDIFTAKVTVIGDATSDSSGNITYDVTVTLEGDVSGLFQGMTADVTFVTEQTEEVLYVSRRAIITEDDKTYVKVKTAEGSIVKKEITTGLSDGSNVEISGDIAEGDTVLIESSITK